MKQSAARPVVQLRSAVALAALIMGACSGEGPDPSIGSTTAAVKLPLDTPTLSQSGATQTTITVTVCAGATGAPAGFSLHWVTADDLAANDGAWPEEGCGASFSGNASGSRFDLAPNECVDVVVGDLAEEPGQSNTCSEGLLCGTEYAFRTFAHGNSDWFKSAFSDPYYFSTLSCDDGCTLTQGYWKNHLDTPGWPVTELTIGTVVYSDEDLLAILEESVSGNGLISLAHQLIAAKLNVENGAASTDVADAIADADALIGTLTVPPIGDGYLAPADTSALVEALAAYNEGLVGPGHCEESEEEAPE